MIKKSILILGILILLVLPGVFALEATFCCERLDSGQWCQNAPESECNTGINPITGERYRSVPTSCEATSYCKPGTCIDSEEGICAKNTPQIVCQKETGVWEELGTEELPQCSLGCCYLADQAAYVTQTRCNRLSLLYGLEIEFRGDIQSEISCLLGAKPQSEGACVFEEEASTSCLFSTRAECSVIESGEFYEGYLCSAEELGTVCGASEKTACFEGKDEVYSVDTCGNKANIYNSIKIDDDDELYWTKITPKNESCNSDSNNANSAACGNCNYLAGSICKEYKKDSSPQSPEQAPDFGNFICKNLGCVYDTNGNSKTSPDEFYEHGETWCAQTPGASEIKIVDGEINRELIPSSNNRYAEDAEENVPGSRYFRLVCYNNEVSVEPCAEFRQEICIESEVRNARTAELSSGMYRNSACRINRWQDCVEQKDREQCLNEDVRDCDWQGDAGGFGFKCRPLFAPGLEFWNQEGDASGTCSVGNADCVYSKKEGGLGAAWDYQDNRGETGKLCKDGNYWKDKVMRTKCRVLGDCGKKDNAWQTKQNAGDY